MVVTAIYPSANLESVHLRKSGIKAIDILLEPDKRMLEKAEANNARLRGVFPGGFALDADHRPHITLLQCFVAETDLEAVCTASAEAIRLAGIAKLELQAVRYYYTPAPGMGVAGICAPLTEEMRSLQKAVIASARPFMVSGADINAFTAGHGNDTYDAALIAYVAGFAEDQAGENFNPHVTTGVAPSDYLDAMIAEPFDEFAFGLAGAAVYQLGPFGTAARKIRSWELGK